MAFAENALPTTHVHKAMDDKNAWECRPRIGPLGETGLGGGSEFRGDCGTLDEFDDAPSKDDAPSRSQVALARTHDGQPSSFTAGTIADTTGDQSVTLGPESIGGDMIEPCFLGDGEQLTPRRLEAVQLYCRDEDPLFVRVNLKRLLEGKLERLLLGDIVNVARRCRGGDRRYGGEGRVVQILPGLFYDIKYAVGGIEKGVDACFVERITVGRRPRGSTPRCPDCNSFLHECLCPGIAKPLTAAIIEAGVSFTYPHESPAKRPRVDPGGRLKETRAQSPAREQLSGVTETVGFEDGVGGETGARTPGKEDAAMGADGHGHARDVGKACAPGGDMTTLRHRGDNRISDSDTERDHTGLGMAEQGTEDSGMVDGASAPYLLHGSATESRSTGPSQHEEHAERKGGNWSSGDLGSDARRHGDTEHSQGEGRTAILRQGGHGQPGVSGELPALSSSGSRGSVDKGKSGQSASRRDPAIDEDGGDAEVQSGRRDDDQPDPTGEWQHRKGDLVEVERRMTPGINKPGGTARVVKVDAVSGNIDVRYVVEGGWERGIHPMYVRSAKLDMSEMKRPTLGRCGHCGSLRVDCKQECDYYMSLRRPRRARRDPVSSVPPLDVPYPDEEASSQGRRNFGRPRESGETALEAEPPDRRKARRHLPDDWDDEGVSMFGSEEDQSAGARRDFDWDDEGIDSEDSNVRLSIPWTPGVLDTQRGASVSENRSTDGGRSDTDDSSEGQDADVDPLRDLSSHIERNRAAGDSQPDVELLHVRPGPRSNRGRIPRDSPTADGGVEGPGARAVRRSKHKSGHDYSPLRSESSGIVAWDDVDVGDAGEEGTARFLMPEGEEASRMLPSDILDPTRGVTDPAVLREELTKLLETMEKRDAEELEKDVPALSRRAAQATAAHRRSGDGSVVVKDLLLLQARIRQVLRRLDIANNIFVRLEKKDARWREGMAGENAWHRLDRMTVRLEEWRRNVDKALREYKSSRPVDERLSESSNSSHRDPTDDDSSASSSCAGEYPEAVVPREHPRRMGFSSEEDPRESDDLRWPQERTVGGTSKSRSSVVRGDDDESVGAIGRSEAGGNRRRINGHSRGRNHPHHEQVRRSRNRKRPRQAIGTGRTSPQHGTAKARKAHRKNGAPSGVDSGGFADSRDTLPFSSDNLEGRYIPGLDYRMAADSDSDGHRNIGMIRVRSSSESSAPSPPSSPWPSHSDPGPLLQLAGENVVSPDEEASGGTRALGGGRRISPGEASYLGKSAWPEQGQRAAGASRESAADRRSKSRATRKGSRKFSERGGARRQEPPTRAGRRRVSIPSEGRYAGGIRGHREVRIGKSRWAEETLFRQRLAEQEARGGGLYARDGWNAATRRQRYAGDDGHAAGETSAGDVRLLSFVEDLLPKPQFGDALVFKTLRAATLDATEVRLGGLVLRAGDCDHASWGQAGDDEEWVDFVRRRLIENARPETTKDAGLERSARGDAAVGETQGGASGASVGPMKGGDDDRGMRCDVSSIGRREGCLSRLQEEDGTGETEDDGLRGSAGQLERALCLLPQQMADLEELAKLGFDDEAKTLARACCKLMAVVSANLRVLASTPTFPSSSSSGTCLRGFRAICALTRQVKQLAEGAAPGRSGEDRDALDGLEKDSEDEDGSPSCSPWTGLSLTDAVSLRRKLRGSRGSNALVGACAAFHSYMLEWLAITGMFQREAVKILAQRGGPGAAPVDENESLSGTAPSPKEGDARRLPTPNLPVSLLEFSRSLLLDLLFLFEKHPPAWPKVSREQELAKDPHSLPLPREIARDPLCELWCILMDTLDGVRDTTLFDPAAVANVNVPGFSRPLVGFWGVFYAVVSGGATSSSRQTDTGFDVCGAGDGGGDVDGGGSRARGWGLPSELVWKVVLHAVRLQLVREGWGDSTAGARGIGSQAEGDAKAAAFRNRRRETSRPLWQCVRLLLAASPFAPEFSGSKEAAAVSANALAAMAKTGLGFGCSGKMTTDSTDLRGRPPLLVAAEAGTSPGMVARVLLERLVVLARVCSPEPGPQGLIENIWKGVQRISVSLCGITMSSAPEARGHARTEDGGEPGGPGEQREDVEARRVRSAEKMSHSPPLEAESLGRLLSSAVRAWCLPVHSMCRLPRATLEGNHEEGRHSRRAEGDYEALCSLTSLLTQEFAMRLPEGLKRRRLANALLKAKYSSSGPNQVSPNDDDDLHVLAPSRVLLAIALGLGRAGLGVDAAKEIVKAAAIRPRNVPADAPRDHPIALAAPAAAALCLALPSRGTDGPGAGDRGGCEAARAALFRVLEGCMKDALRLLARVLDEASRLGQAICPNRLERPKAAVGLVASCILVALRHLGPRTGFRRSPFDLASARAAEPFLEVLGRALDKRFAILLGRPACTVVLSALFHCLPPAVATSGNVALRQVLGESRGDEHAVSAGIERGYAMGWWKRTYPGAGMGEGGQSEQHGESSSAMPPRADGGVEGMPGDGGVSQGAATGGNQAGLQEDENRDEYGSWDGFPDDAELDALLSGRTDEPTGGSQNGTEREGAARAEDEATSGVEERARMERVQKEEELWRSLSTGVATNVLPHLPDILKRAWTMARYAQSGSSSSIRAGTVEAARDDPLHRSSRTFSGGENGCAVGAIPSAVPPLSESPVDAGVILMLHASAALALLRGSFTEDHSDNSRQPGNDAQAIDFASVRDKYLDLNHAAQHPLVPQQRLLAPAFFCLMLSEVRGEDRCLHGDDDTGGLSVNRGHSLQSARAPVRVPDPRVLLRETLRGREWDVLHIWIQAALDPATFPMSRRGDRPRGPGRRGRGGAVGKGKEPSDLVRDGFRDFTRGLAQALRSCGALEVEGSGAGGWGGREASDSLLLDGDLADALEKRLIRFDPGTLSQLTSEENLVLERVLDMQSVMAHCGELWSTALVIAAPAPLREADRKRLKDRVIKLVHFSVKTLRRFLSEVFPREYTIDSSRDGGKRLGNGALESRDNSPAGIYGSTFRRLYGHAVYALVAFLTRMCGGALKGPPLRDLVEACFEGIASRPVEAKDGGAQDRRDGAGVGNAPVSAGTLRGRGGPHRELTSLAVMHASDLLVCFSEMPMTVAPVAGWLKNINDHAINGSLSSVSDSSSLCRGHAATLVPPLVRSLAAGLCGQLRYPSPAYTLPPPSRASGKIDFGGAIENIALAPPPRTPRTVLAKEQILARMRSEMLGDRKLRIARFLMEAATGERRDQQRAGAVRGIGRGAFASRTGRLLLLIAEIFRRREEPCNPPGALPSPPSLDFRRDIAGLLRPVYSLLGEALLGEPGPARRLGSQSLLAATALSTAGLDASGSVPQGSGVRDALVVEADATVERRLALCYAEVVVLAMSTKLETFLTAMGTENEGDVESDGFKHEQELTLADLGDREVDLERLLRGLGVWEAHGAASGWPHSAPPPRPEQASTMATAAEETVREAEGSEQLDAPLPILVARAEGMVEAFRSTAGETNRRWWRRVERVILARVESCKRLLPEARAR